MHNMRFVKYQSVIFEFTMKDDLAGGKLPLGNLEDIL